METSIFVSFRVFVVADTIIKDDGQMYTSWSLCYISAVTYFKPEVLRANMRGNS